MKERVFRFKRFSVSHSECAMKVGVDGVLLGLWVPLPASGRVLDAGAGCGVISLMIAQRAPSLRIDAVEIDAAAASEAASNFAASAWGPRLRCAAADWLGFAMKEGKYDLIVSNPPFYDAGVDPGASVRMTARHSGSLSPAALLEHGAGLLTPEGEVAMIFPAQQLAMLEETGIRHGLGLRRLTTVANHPGAGCKRILGCWGRGEADCERTHLTLFAPDKVTPTPEYRAMGRNFYLKF